jgi:hypothetical protein
VAEEHFVYNALAGEIEEKRGITKQIKTGGMFYHV